MKQEILIHFPWPWLSTLALMIFFTFFIGLVARLTMKSRRRVFALAERLPLSDGDKRD